MTFVDAQENEVIKAEYNTNAYISAKYESEAVSKIIKALNNYGVSTKIFFDSFK